MAALLSRHIRQLKAEEYVVLLILEAGTAPMNPEEIQESMGVEGERFPVMGAIEFLEDEKIIVRAGPKVRGAVPDADYILTDDARALLEVSDLKAIVGELRARIAKLERPHERDGSVAPAGTTDSLKQMEAFLMGTDTVKPVHKPRPKAVVASRPRRIRQQREEDQGQDGAPAAFESPAPAPVRPGRGTPRPAPSAPEAQPAQSAPLSPATAPRPNRGPQKSPAPRRVAPTAPAQS